MIPPPPVRELYGLVLVLLCCREAAQVKFANYFMGCPLPLFLSLTPLSVGT